MGRWVIGGSRSFSFDSAGVRLSLVSSVVVMLLLSVVTVAVQPAYAADCSTIAVKNFHGVNYPDPTLAKKEGSGLGKVQTAKVSEDFSYIKSNGFNFIRVPIYWESYVNDPASFIAEADLIAKTAQANGLCVVFTNFHYYTSSYWDVSWNGFSMGKGFPSSVVSNFAKKDTYISTAGPFWNAFLSNNIWVGGMKIWDAQFAYLSKVIKKVNAYTSVAGYEILNEPHLFNTGMYDKLGDYHTYMAKKIRTISAKKIFFDRETAWGFTRAPSLEYKIFPEGVTKLVYSPQMYAIPYPGPAGMKQVNNFKTWSQQFGTEVLITEMAPKTSADALQYLNTMKLYGFGWSAYGWTKTSSGLAGAYYESNIVTATPDLKILRAAIDTVY